MQVESKSQEHTRAWFRCGVRCGFNASIHHVPVAPALPPFTHMHPPVLLSPVLKVLGRNTMLCLLWEWFGMDCLYCRQRHFLCPEWGPNFHIGQHFMTWSLSNFIWFWSVHWYEASEVCVYKRKGLGIFLENREKPAATQEVQVCVWSWVSSVVWLSWSTSQCWVEWHVPCSLGERWLAFASPLKTQPGGSVGRASGWYEVCSVSYSWVQILSEAAHFFHVK